MQNGHQAPLAATPEHRALSHPLSIGCGPQSNYPKDAPVQTYFDLSTGNGAQRRFVEWERDFPKGQLVKSEC